jgi:hypothetical protein
VLLIGGGVEDGEALSSDSAAARTSWSSAASQHHRLGKLQLRRGPARAANARWRGAGEGGGRRRVREEKRERESKRGGMTSGFHLHVASTSAKSPLKLSDG